jgi:hypothetical protein
LKKITFNYYLLLLLLAPLAPRILLLTNSLYPGYSLPLIGETLLLVLLAGGLTFLVLRTTGVYWELALAGLWALCQARVLDLGLTPVTSAWKAFDAGQGVKYLGAISLGPNLLAALFYLALLFASIKIARLKGKLAVQFAFLSLAFYQLGYRLIDYKF